MNENSPVPPPMPPFGSSPESIPPPSQLSAAALARAAKEAPLGDDPADRAPIPHVFAAIDAMLRHPRQLLFHLRQPDGRRVIPGMVMATLACLVVYGVVVGTFSGGVQLWAAPVKIAAGLFISGAICLPSLYIFTCLSGSKARLVEVAGLLTGLLMLMTILLIGFAPVAWIFSQSTSSIVWMGALHLAFWFVATLFGVRFIVAGYSHSEAKSRGGLNVWILIFMLVSLQMTTTLRPLLGTSKDFVPSEKKFFLSHWADCVNGTAERANGPR